MNKHSTKWRGLYGISLLTTLCAPLAAQSNAPDPSVNEEEVFILSPFEVSTTEDESYYASDTLAGTRVKTNLRDIASSITVVTSKFLDDTGSTSAEDLLVYTTNTEVGGLEGNYSGLGGAVSYNENAKLLRPNSNTRVRGLDAADSTRDLFLSNEIPWDSFNIDRVDLQRGPNSILFGVGSPAGIVNTGLKTAVFKDSDEIKLQIGKFSSIRATFDANHEIIENELAIRLAGVADNQKYRQDPAHQDSKRFYMAVRYEPKLFGKGSYTSIRANAEFGEIDANRPRTLPPVDGITPWFLTGESYGYTNLNKLTLNPNITWSQYAENDIYPNGFYPWFAGGQFGRMINPDIGSFYDAASSTPMFNMTPEIGISGGIDENGNIDGTINGMEFARRYAITTYNNYAREAIPGGKYYSNVSLKDSSIFDFYNKLIDGDNKKEWQEWDTQSLFISQTFFDNMLGFEYAFYNQNYEEGQNTLLNGDQYIMSVDINTHLRDGNINPNLGRPYVANSGQYGNNWNFVDRQSQRGTVYLDLVSEDFMEKSWFTRIFSRFLITGLYSRDTKDSDLRTFTRWASEPAFTEYTGADSDITNGLRQFDWVAYLGDSLLDASSPSGANLSNVKAKIDPSGPITFRMFDSHWNAPNVNPADPYTYIDYDEFGVPIDTEGTQAENPANYIGWTTATYNVLNAEKGDIKQLYTQVTKSKNQVTSKALTLQGYFLDNNLVGTWGWRKDQVKNIGQNAPKLDYDISDVSFKLDSLDSEETYVAEGESISWGVVLHTPDFIKEKMPLGLNVSAFYNSSENFKADAPRGDIFGNQIPNPIGNSEDYGLVISALDDKLSFKVTWYETSVKNATLAGDNAGFASNLYYVWALPYWEATHALAALDGISDPQLRQGSWGWPWNEIATDEEGNPDNARIQEIVNDFFANFPLDQRFVDEYGLEMNPDAMRAATTNEQRYASVPGYGINDQGASALGIQPAYGGNLKSFGTPPNASVDTTSEGIEFEINALPLPNWRITVNFSKTEATRSSISPTIDNWIKEYTEFMNGDAGLIRLWGGNTFRQDWENNILAPYAVLKGQIGSNAPEISPWRFNMVTNYDFREGFLKNVNVGLAYRWEDKRILGYQYDANNDILDIDKPWYGPTDDHYDLWIGYGTKLNDKINWRIQLNLKNVGEDPHLVPVSMQPNGDIALSRIHEGMTWTLTNTVSF